MTLLRGPTSPDADTDQGEHSFTLAIMPHRGGLTEGKTYEMARAFTSPIYREHLNIQPPHTVDLTFGSLVRTKPKEMPRLPQFEVVGDDSGHVVLETIKRAEDGDKSGMRGALILRMFESLGGKAKAQLKM